MKIFTKSWAWGGIGCFLLAMPDDLGDFCERYARTQTEFCELLDLAKELQAFWEKP